MTLRHPYVGKHGTGNNAAANNSCGHDGAHGLVWHNDHSFTEATVLVGTLHSGGPSLQISSVQYCPAGWVWSPYLTLMKLPSIEGECRYEVVHN